MALGLTHLLVRQPVSDLDADRWQRVFVRAAVLFLAFRVLSETPLWPLAKPTTTPHEQLFFFALGLAAAVLTHRRGALVVILVLATVMFLQYPAATWLVVVMSAVATGWATSRRGRRTATFVMFAFAVGVLGFGFLQVQGGQSSLAKTYFTAVSKGDDTSTRSELWKAAEHEIGKSPLVGSVYSGYFTVPNVNGVITTSPLTARVEIHNDYLQQGVLGGLFGLFLFGGFIISTNVVMMRRIRRLSDLGAGAELDLARVLLIAFNAALSGAVFNPELSQLGTCLSIFLVYSLMMTVRPQTDIATQS